jgi:hypothetical protein
MLPKFCAGTPITDLEKGDMFWLVLRILPSIKFVQIFHNIQPALYPYQYPAYALTKAYVS